MQGNDRYVREAGVNISRGAAQTTNYFYYLVSNHYLGKIKLDIYF